MESTRHFLMLLLFGVAFTPVAATELTAAECQQQGGIWQPVCFRQIPFCLKTTADQGRPCTDSSQCEAGCEADLPLPSDPTLPVSGHCRANNNPCGCFALIHHGQPASMLCRD